MHWRDSHLLIFSSATQQQRGDDLDCLRNIFRTPTKLCRKGIENRNFHFHLAASLDLFPLFFRRDLTELKIDFSLLSSLIHAWRVKFLFLFILSFAHTSHKPLGFLSNDIWTAQTKCYVIFSHVTISQSNQLDFMIIIIIFSLRFAFKALMRPRLHKGGYFYRICSWKCSRKFLILRHSKKFKDGIWENWF